MWVLSIIEEFDVIPAKYFKKIDRESNIYESRIDFGGNTYRLLSFFFEGNFIVLSNGFMKKTKKIPKDEITVCIRRMRDFVNRGGES
jgi:phage-related protein